MKHIRTAGFIATAMILMLFIACGGGEEIKRNPFIGKAMVPVKGGTFTMGCAQEYENDCMEWEHPAHDVTVGDFYIGKMEVTQAQWKSIMNGDNPSRFKGDSLPVENVSWHDVQAFIRRLNELSGENFRLPTEAEWEYAARGGVKSNNYKYSGSDTADEVAWYGSVETRPVGIKAANELDIHDMSGNVWEWVSDWHGNYSAESQTDPKGPDSSTNRVLRGGGWNSNARYARVTHRNGGTPGFRHDTIGFRVARNVR